jgi:hypothetical protein
MTVRSRLTKFVRQRDWRIWFGLAVTFVWISGGLYFVSEIHRSNPGQLLTLESLGGFVEGAFARLAVLWLVLGLFIQQRELARHADELQRSTENARQDTFFKIAESVNHQLGGISGMLFASGLGPAGSGRYDREQMDELFSKAANGDSEIFARQFLSIDFLQEGGLPDLLYGTEIRRRHSRNFRHTFERLLMTAKSYDSDGILVDSMNNTAFGLLYSRMERYTPGKSADEAGT